MRGNVHPGGLQSGVEDPSSGEHICSDVAFLHTIFIFYINKKLSKKIMTGYQIRCILFHIAVGKCG